MKYHEFTMLVVILVVRDFENGKIYESKDHFCICSKCYKYQIQQWIIFLILRYLICFWHKKSILKQNKILLLHHIFYHFISWHTNYSNKNTICFNAHQHRFYSKQLQLRRKENKNYVCTVCARVWISFEKFAVVASLLLVA